MLQNPSTAILKLFLFKCLQEKSNIISCFGDSAKAFHQERKKLIKEVPRKFSKQERERIYLKWGVRLNSKRRSQQLAGRLWMDTKDMDHIKKSAALVACLVGFLRPSQVPKEIFRLTFLSHAVSQRSFMWKPSLSTLSVADRILGRLFNPFCNGLLYSM